LRRWEDHAKDTTGHAVSLPPPPVPLQETRMLMTMSEQDKMMAIRHDGDGDDPMFAGPYLLS
jgi:hypothetical protein